MIGDNLESQVLEHCLSTISLSQDDVSSDSTYGLYFQATGIVL
jgi:hypothetical protein